jgi:excisionase family DNA binding protein
MTLLPQFNLNRTIVGGNELKAMRCTPAAYRGALTHEYEPTMSAEIDPASEGYRVLTVKEVAAHFRVCRRTIEREIAAGHFPRPLKIGRCSRFTESDLAAYEEKLRQDRSLPPSP